MGESEDDNCEAAEEGGVDEVEDKNETWGDWTRWRDVPFFSLFFPAPRGRDGSRPWHTASLADDKPLACTKYGYLIRANTVGYSVGTYIGMYCTLFFVSPSLPSEVNGWLVIRPAPLSLRDTAAYRAECGQAR